MYDIVERIKELNKKMGEMICAHSKVDVVLDGYGRIKYEICRSCGKRINESFNSNRENR